MNFDFDFLDKKEFNTKLFFLIFIIISLAIYVGFLIYGNRGLNRLIELEQNKEVLQKAVDNLKQENVLLQKKFFELKEIEDGE